jgi:hypothetical protein
MMTSRSLICLLENQNGGKLQKTLSCYLYTGLQQSMATVTYLENGFSEILEIWYGVKSI